MYSVLILILGVFPTALMFSIARAERDFGTPHPIRVVAWILLFGYTLKSVYLAYAVATNAPFRTSHLPRDIIPLGQTAIILGSIAFILGYLLFRGNTSNIKIVPRKISRINFDPRIAYYTLFFVSLALMIMFFYKMEFMAQILSLKFRASKFFLQEDTNIKSSLGFLTVGADFLMVYFLYDFAYRKKISPTSVYFLAILFVLLCFFLSSRRNGVIIVVVLFLMVRNYRDVAFRVPAFLKKARAWVTIGSVLLILAFAGQIRKGGGEKSLLDLDIYTAVTVSAEHALQGAYFLDPAKTSAIIDYVDTNDSYLLGSSFFNTLLAPIPRVWWPEKPNIRIGPYVGQEILRFNNESGAPPGGIGELYLNFGWPGVFIGMAVLGAIVARLWRQYIASADRRFERIPLAVYIASVMIFLLVEFSGAVVILVKFQIGIFVCKRYWRWREARQMT